jgi:putative ABC transport system ATP-binding protein
VVLRADADNRREVDGVSACHAEALSKVYGTDGTAVHALRDVTLDIPRRSFTAIMGPSGSGKSTLLHCLAALDTPTSGRVFLGDTELTALSRRRQARVRRDRIGFVFQAFNLVPTLDALENITLPQLLAGRSPDQEWLHHVISRLGLGDRMHHRPNELSGGQQQRIALARALAGRPEVIFADEPTGNLDTTASSEMLTLLRDAVDQFEQTVVTVTHDPSVARYADQILQFSDGRVVGHHDRRAVGAGEEPHHDSGVAGSGGLDPHGPADTPPRPDGQHTMRSRRRRQPDEPTPGRPMVGSDDEVEVARQERWLQRIREQFEAEHEADAVFDQAPTGARGLWDEASAEHPSTRPSTGDHTQGYAPADRADDRDAGTALDWERRPATGDGRTRGGFDDADPHRTRRRFSTPPPPAPTRQTNGAESNGDHHPVEWNRDHDPAARNGGSAMWAERHAEPAMPTRNGTWRATPPAVEPTDGEWLPPMRSWDDDGHADDGATDAHIRHGDGWDDRDRRPTDRDRRPTDRDRRPDDRDRRPDGHAAAPSRHQRHADSNAQPADRGRRQADGYGTLHGRGADPHSAPADADEHRHDAEDHRWWTDTYREPADAWGHRPDADEHRVEADEHRVAADEHRPAADEHRVDHRDQGDQGDHRDHRGRDHDYRDHRGRDHRERDHRYRTVDDDPDALHQATQQTTPERIDAPWSRPDTNQLSPSEHEGSQAGQPDEDVEDPWAPADARKAEEYRTGQGTAPRGNGWAGHDSGDIWATARFDRGEVHAPPSERQVADEPPSPATDRFADPAHDGMSPAVAEDLAKPSREAPPALTDRSAQPSHEAPPALATPSHAPASAPDEPGDHGAAESFARPGQAIHEGPSPATEVDQIAAMDEPSEDEDVRPSTGVSRATDATRHRGSAWDADADAVLDEVWTPTFGRTWQVADDEAAKGPVPTPVDTDDGVWSSGGAARLGTPRDDAAGRHRDPEAQDHRPSDPEPTDVQSTVNRRWPHHDGAGDADHADSDSLGEDATHHHRDADSAPGRPAEDVGWQRPAPRATADDPPQPPAPPRESAAEPAVPAALASLRSTRRADQADDARAALESLQQQLDRLAGRRGGGRPRPGTPRGADRHPPD